MATAEVLLPERVFFSDGEEWHGEELQRLFAVIARADSVEALKTILVPAVARRFAARRAALMVFAEMFGGEIPAEVRDNPVMRFLTEHHAPVHDALILPPGQWSTLCPWHDHGHVLCGPVVRGGVMIGALALTRGVDQAAFAAADLADVSALCLHLCAWFARWDSAGAAETDLHPLLTPRERQIVVLVAEGLTNAQIGQRLCISMETVKAALKIVFRKTGLHSRTQLAARQQK